MAWDDTFANVVGRDEPVELVGTNLRLTGVVNLGRFARLTDFINASRGYIRIRDAQLLSRNGEPTNLVLQELMVDQDEISFIAQIHTPPPEPGTGTEFDSGFGPATTTNRTAREFVLFTPGHTVTGKVHIFGETDLAGFVDTSDPRFVPVISVTTQSLADRRIISHYEFLLINRTQMIAASEIVRADGVHPDDVPPEAVPPDDVPEP